jgi:hypothetical protein
MGSDPQTRPIERSPRPFVAEVAEHELVRETTDREECRPSRPSNVSPAFSRDTSGPPIVANTVFYVGRINGDLGGWMSVDE